MNNFKKLLASAMALAMVTSVLPAANVTTVNAATQVVSTSGWENSDGKGVTVKKGIATIGTDAIDGAFTKENTSKITKNGVTVSAHVELEGLSHGELFALSAGVNNTDGNYATEFLVQTVKSGDEYVLSSGLNPADTITVTEEGVYTYSWTFKKDADNNLSAVFTLENYGEVVGTIEVDEFEKVDGTVASLRYLWAFGRYTADGYVLDQPLKIYDELPVRVEDGKEEVTYKVMRTVLDSFETVKMDALTTDTKVGSGKVLGSDLEYLPKNTNAIEAILGSDAVKYFALEDHSDVVSVSNYSDYLKSVKFAKNLRNLAININSLVAEINAAEKLLNNTKWETAKERDYDKAFAAYETLTEGYGDLPENNLTEDQKDDYARVVADLEEVLKDYGFTGKQLKDYVNAVDEVYKNLVKGKTVYNENKANDYITKADVENAINSIKNGVKDDDTLTKANYKRYGEDSEDVQEIIEELEGMFDSIKEVNTALNKTRNEAYKAFVKKPAGDKSVKDKVASAKVKNENTLAAIMDALTVEEYEIYKAFKEEIIDVLFTMKSDEIGSRVYDDSEKTMFASSKTVAAYLDLLRTPMIDFYEKDNAFGWDYYTTHMETVKASLAIIENELPKLDSINIKATDRDAIMAARDAVDYLEDATSNLTAKENKELKNAADKVDELIFTYRTKFGSLNVTTGWVDVGNGNWKFYEADGTAPTRWVASTATDWYYVSNGSMLRNAWVWRDANSAYYVGNDGKMVYGPTTIDGYALDANGLWQK